MNNKYNYTIKNILTPFKTEGDSRNKTIHIGDIYACESKNIPILFELSKIDVDIKEKDKYNICEIIIEYFNIQSKSIVHETNQLDILCEYPRKSIKII